MKRNQLYLSRQIRALKLGKYVEFIDTALEEVAEKEPRLKKAVGRAITSSGKRFRPLLALLTCEAFCGDYRPALPLALTFELAHSASLVQDDIIDRSELRRSQPSVYAEYGVARAILVSDILIFEIFGQLADLERWNLAPQRLYMLLKLISGASKDTIFGEYLQMEMALRGDVSEDKYFEMVKKKTGALLAASAASGAVIGGGAADKVDAMYRFGEKLGVAYQLQDDLLDMIGRPGEIGKPIFKDLEGRNSNIVVIHALANAGEDDRNRILELWGKDGISREDIKAARSILLKTGSIDYTLKLAAKMTDESRQALRVLKPSPARHKLLELTYYITSQI